MIHCVFCAAFIGFQPRHREGKVNQSPYRKHRIHTLLLRRHHCRHILRDSPQVNQDQRHSKNEGRVDGRCSEATWFPPYDPEHDCLESVWVGGKRCAITEQRMECRRGLAIRILSVCLSVCPSVCQTCALWQNGRKIGPYFDIKRKNI